MITRRSLFKFFGVAAPVAVIAPTMLLSSDLEQHKAEILAMRTEFGNIQIQLDDLFPSQGYIDEYDKLLKRGYDLMDAIYDKAFFLEKKNENKI